MCVHNKKFWLLYFFRVLNFRLIQKARFVHIKWKFERRRIFARSILYNIKSKQIMSNNILSAEVSNSYHHGEV